MSFAHLDLTWYLHTDALSKLIRCSCHSRLMPKLKYCSYPLQSENTDVLS